MAATTMGRPARSWQRAVLISIGVAALFFLLLLAVGLLGTSSLRKGGFSTTIQGQFYRPD